METPQSATTENPLDTATLQRLWHEALGPAAAPDTGFISNGGDSFAAVVLAGEILSTTGREIGYLDILQATSVADLRDRILGE